jgi:hypothetical protein
MIDLRKVHEQEVFELTGQRTPALADVQPVFVAKGFVFEDDFAWLKRRDRVEKWQSGAAGWHIPYRATWFRAGSTHRLALCTDPPVEAELAVIAPGHRPLGGPVCFCLPPMPAGRRLLLMGSGNAIGAWTSAGSDRPVVAPTPDTLLQSLPGWCSDDTLHCSNTFTGKPVQFNSSVSARSPHPSGNFDRG